MKHPELAKREREEQFRKRCNRYWYRWMGLYTLALFAVVALIYAGHHESYAALGTMLSGMFVVGIGITAWLARQRARDEMAQHADSARRHPPAD